MVTFPYHTRFSNAPVQAGNSPEKSPLLWKESKGCLQKDPGADFRFFCETIKFQEAAPLSAGSVYRSTDFRSPCQKCRPINTCAKRSKSKEIPDFFPVDRLCIGAHKQILTDTHDHLFQTEQTRFIPISSAIRLLLSYLLRQPSRQQCPKICRFLFEKGELSLLSS